MDNAEPASDLPEDVETLVLRVSRFIREALPDAEERIYKDGWSRGYHAPQGGAFCGLFPRRNAVYLSFPQAHLLPDPEGLLKDERHVALRPGEPLPEEPLFELLLAAMLMQQ